MGPGGDPGPYVYPAGNGLPGNMSIGPIPGSPWPFAPWPFGPPWPFAPPPAGPGGWLARTAYRLDTGDMSVEDENVNAYPDAWEPNGPPGAQMGLGG